MPGRYFAALVTALFASSIGWAASPPAIVGDPGATIDDLIREQSLVTIVLNNGARATNYRLRSLSEETLGVTDTSGTQTVFRLDQVREVRVQSARIEPRETRKESALTTEDRRIVDGATQRAYDLFNESRGNQTIKMLAATTLAASGHEARMGAQAYLRELSTGNDAPTAVLAAALLWTVGDEASDTAISAGLSSGNRETRALATTLAGLSRNQKYLVDVRRMLKDPAVEIFPAAAVAIARLGDRESLPALYDGIRALDERKGQACVIALTILGGDDVRQRLLTMLPDSRGNEWFRIVRALHEMGDEQATDLLRDTALRQPAFQREAALLLLEQGSVEAVQFLRNFLEKPQDPNVENLVYKTRVGIALYDAGDIQAKGIIQDVLNVNPSLIYERGRAADDQFKQNAVIEIQARTCELLGNTMNREMLSLLAAPIQSSSPIVAVTACGAAMQIANPEYGEREKESDH